MRTYHYLALVGLAWSALAQDKDAKIIDLPPGKDTTIERPTKEVTDKIVEHEADIAAKETAYDDTVLNAVGNDRNLVGLVGDTVRRYCEIPAPGTVDVHAYPIRAIDPKTGDYAPIDTAWTQVTGEDAFENTVNLFTTKVHANGMKELQSADVTLYTWPVAFSMNGDSVPMPTEATTIKRAAVDTLELRGSWPLDIVQELVAQSGRVKDNLILPDIRADLDPLRDEFVRATWAMKYAGLRFEQTTEKGVSEVFVFADDGRPFFVIAEPMLVDAAGKRARGRWLLAESGDAIELLAPAAWLDDPARTYPVVLDPTTDSTDLGSVSRASHSGSGASEVQYRNYFKVNLPPINGSCDGAEFRAYCTSTSASGDGFAGTINLYTAGESDTATWDLTTSGTTLAAIGVYDPSVGVAFDVSSFATGWHSWTDVKGVTGNADCIEYAYDDGTSGVCDPGSFTIKLQTSASGLTATTNTTYFQFYEQGGDDVLVFDNYGGTNPPVLRLTYTGTLTCGGGVVAGRRATGAGIIQ